jgi:nucleoside-diphosphate-sugar epimerase
LEEFAMKIFIAGATGAVGRPLVSACIEAGHSVIGLTRTQTKAELIREMGAEPAIADGLDTDAVAEVLSSTRPDAVIHEMTNLAGATDLRNFDRTFAGSNQLRTRGTDILLAAARASGVKRFIAQSYCGWPYARTGDAIKTEADALDPDPPAELRATLEAIQYVEKTVTRSVHPEGIVLRYGSFYGPGTGMLDNAMLAQISNRRMPLIGDGAGWWSFVHVADAATATVRALEHGRPGSIYNIVDDDPAQVREWLPALAEIVGAKRPIHLPAWIARIIAGEHLVTMMTQVRAGSNRKARTELGWQPHHPYWREGFSEIARHSGAQRTAT